MPLNRKQKIRYLLSLAVFCMCTSVYGAEGDYLLMDLDQLLQIPVTGSTLHDESLKTVPAAVTVFTHDQLEKLGVDYLYELVNLVPSFQFSRGGDSGVSYTFSSRGRRNGTQAREILVVMDGRLLASPRTGSVDISLPFIPLERIERIEVIRGPGSAIYGSSAFAGVINIITRTHQNDVWLEFGSNERRKASAMLTQSIGEWNANVYSRVYEDKGQSFGVKDTFSRLPIQTSDPRKMIGLDISASRENTKLRFAYDSTSGSDFYQIENTFNGFNSFDVDLTQFSFEQELHLVDSVSSRVSLDYLNVTQHLNVAVLPAGALAQISNPSSPDPLLSKGTLIGKSYNLRLTNDWAVDEESTALLGMEWKYDSETDASIKNNYDLGQFVQGVRPVSYYGDFTHGTPLGLMQSLHSKGIFTQYQRQLNERTGLTLGLRYDDYEDLSMHGSPRLGLVHQFNENHTFKLLYGEAYRAPSLSEMGIINNPLILGNPKLNYESVKTWDLIWLANWKNTRFSLGAFANSFNDPIVAGLIGATRTFVNSVDEHSNGVALELFHCFNEQWYFHVTHTKFLSLPKTAFREADQLSSFELNFSQGAWNWNLLGYHQGERYTLGANNSLHKLDDFWVINSKLRWDFGQGYSVSLQAKNVADTEYSTPSQGVNIPDGIPNRRREVSLILGWTF